MKNVPSRKLIKPEFRIFHFVLLLNFTSSALRG